MRKLKELEERGSVAPVNFVVKVNKCSVITAVQLLLQEKKGSYETRERYLFTLCILKAMHLSSKRTTQVNFQQAKIQVIEQYRR